MRMTDEEFEGAFGMSRVQSTLTESRQQRAREVNNLFDEMRAEYGWGSREVFRVAADGLHGAFLHNVADCPEFVIELCQRMLAPDAKMRHRAQKKN